MKKILIILGCLYLSFLTTGCFLNKSIHKEVDEEQNNNDALNQEQFIDKINKSTIEDIAHGFITRAESYVASYMMDNYGDWKDSDEFICNGIECKNNDNYVLKSPSEIPQSGSIIINEKGVASIKKDNPLVFNNYICVSISDYQIECNKK